MLSGRGLWYGAVDEHGRNKVFDSHSWGTACAQAKAWGMAIVHPKVADGGYVWYDANGLKMLRSIAEGHGLVCGAYHYCYGNKYGALDHEAQISAQIGQICGMVCPDIEVEWEVKEGAEWAVEYGKMLRKAFSGPVYPTVFANPQQHPLPWFEVNQWATGMMPQVYFSEWVPQTTDHAINYVYPQWIALDNALKKRGKGLIPLLPIISLDKNVPMREVASWLQRMQHYGYCGFWYDALYGVYATTVKAAPVPGPAPATPPPSHPHVATTMAPKPVVVPALSVTPVVVATPPVVAPVVAVEAEKVVVAEAPKSKSEPVSVTVTPVAVATEEDTSFLTAPAPTLLPGAGVVQPFVQEVLTDRQLALMWGSNVDTITFDESHPLCAFWCDLTRRYPYIYIGAPTHDEIQVSRNSEDFIYITCESGRRLIYFMKEKVACLL